jgi:uncharacterized phage protein gp47/JayE
VVVPESAAPNPTPGEGTRRTVCAYLNARRLLTTELYVIAPTYQLVSVTGSVTALDSADVGEVQDGIEAALLAYFHPLTGGEDGQGWPFGGTIYYSRVYQRIFTATGVQSIESLTITLDGEDSVECANVPIKEGALLYSTVHNVQANYASG